MGRRLLANIQDPQWLVIAGSRSGITDLVAHQGQEAARPNLGSLTAYSDAVLGTTASRRSDSNPGRNTRRSGGESRSAVDVDVVIH